MIVFLLACSDHTLSTLPKDVPDAWPAIDVFPGSLEFWGVGSGETEVLPVTITSVGVATLRVDDLVIEGDGSFTLADSAGFDLPEDEQHEALVEFTPLVAGDLTAELVVTSDDPDHPEIRVPLSGEGYVPSLQITPDPWTFDALPPGCSDTVTLTLQNVGTEDLTVDDWSIDGAAYTFTPALEPPFTLAPYATTQVEVTFSPTAEGTFTNQLSVSSNDPRGVVTATQSGDGLPADTQVDTFTTEADPPVDLLFAVDQSGSMDDDSAGLGAAFTALIDGLGAATYGWHVGVVTLDDGCFNGGVLETSTPDLATTFADAVVEGDDVDLLYDEALFQLVDLALEEADGGCNAGFLREDALLHVIVVSDEPERSTEQASAWTWGWYYDRWLDHVGGADLLRVSGVVDTEGCNEGDDGYDDAIAATDGEALSICSADWAGHVARLAEASINQLWTFDLTEVPAAGSLSVTVDGSAWTDWAWNTDRNTVTVDGVTAGQTVVVTYTIAQSCE